VITNNSVKWFSENRSWVDLTKGHVIPQAFMFLETTFEVERRGRMVRMSDSQPDCREFESRRRHGVVSVSRIP
jgi:hypothetical protein